jgi:hypothetical protein
MVSVVTIKVGFSKKQVKSVTCLDFLSVLCALCVKGFSALQQIVHQRKHRGQREESRREQDGM